MYVTGLPPLVAQNPRVLVLGSLPGEESLRLQQYYAHPRNVFWAIMGELCAAGPTLPYNQRIAKLGQAGIALWDVLKHGEREGSLDSKILEASAIPNELGEFFQGYPSIKSVCFNGKRAAKSFGKLVSPTVDEAILERIAWMTLPSTSPANASVSKAGKIEIWKRAIEPYLRTK